MAKEEDDVYDITSAQKSLSTDQPGRQRRYFISMMVRDCYPAEMQLIFALGLKQMEEKCMTMYNKNFLSLSIEERQKILVDLRTETIAAKQTASFFTIARDLTLLGYFSSEIGCTQAREYLPIPGRYDGSAEYKPGQKAWATN